MHRLGINFLVQASEAPEPSWTESWQSAGEFVLAAARNKTKDILQGTPRGVVLGADTVISLEGSVLGKARSREQALDMLHRLSGRTHKVLTGCCLTEKGGGEEAFIVATDVAMAAVEEDVLRAYVDTGEYEGKAGAYAIQGVGSFLVQGISGSYTNVVGLPLQEVLSGLLRMEAVRIHMEDNPNEDG